MFGEVMLKHIMILNIDFFFTVTSIHRESRVLAITFRRLFWKILPKTDFRQWICNIYFTFYIMLYFYILLIIWMIGYKYVSNALYFFSITSWICHPWGWCCPDQRQKEINHQALSQSAWAFLKIDVIFAFFIVLFLILVKCK